MKKAVLVSCFNYYDNRLKFVEEQLIKKGYEVFYIYSDFDHIKKKKLTSYIKKENHIILNVPKYIKNFSFKRILSHFIFSRKVYAELKEKSPELVYCMIPPNFLSYYVMKYKKNDKKNKIIFDIYDLWPESFPVKNNKYLIDKLIRPWGLIRDFSLESADYIVTECDYYQSILKFKKEDNVNTLHLMKTETDIEKKEILRQLNSEKTTLDYDQINVAYLGSLNNIIDIEKIIFTLKSLNTKRKVRFNLIGTGETKEQLLNKLSEIGIEYVDYGIVYDFESKKRILQECDFGINMMKDSVTVGLTMKSIEYFQFGLPLLNNIKGDSQKIVLEEAVGFNITENNMENIINDICNLSLDDLIEMKKKSRRVYENYFSYEAFSKKLNWILKDIQ